MEVAIDVPKAEDFETVNQLAKQVHSLHVEWRPDLFLDVKQVITQEYFEEMLLNKNIVVAKRREEIVGYMTFSISEKNHHGVRFRKYFKIDAICVDEKNRGIGAGTELLKYAKEKAKENGCTDLDLTVNEENENAIKMYEKFGFKVRSIAYSMKI